jgi:CBS domain-containing protein
MTDTERIPQAEDFMNRDVKCVGPDDRLEDVTNFLITHKISNAPVVQKNDAGNKILVGFLTEEDCLEHLSNELFFGRTEQAKTARMIMKPHPICVCPDTDLFTLASIFVSHNYRHLPVTDGDQLLGIVSRRDILKAIDAYYREYVIRSEMEHFPPDISRVENLRFFPKLHH